MKKFKTWLIHKLGGYTKEESYLRHESVHRSNISRVRMQHRYTTDLLRMSCAQVHMEERNKAIHKLLKNLEPYIVITEDRDCITHEWVIRLSLSVVER